jgi:nicotinamidase-related amidase
MPPTAFARNPIQNHRMPIARNPSLSGSAPDSSTTALLILDMISDFEFEDGDRICRAAASVVERISTLKRRAARADIPVIYVNDNRGRWRSDFAAHVQRSAAQGSRGQAIARRLAPDPVDYCILKPKHSAFYATVLGTLLEHLGVRRLILTGVTAQQCVLFTANDGHVRDLELLIPRDCVASESRAAAKLALRYFQEVLGVDVTVSPRIRLAAPRKVARGPAARRAARKRAAHRS